MMTYISKIKNIVLIVILEEQQQLRIEIASAFHEPPRGGLEYWRSVFSQRTWDPEAWHSHMCRAIFLVKISATDLLRPLMEPPRFLIYDR